MAKNIPSTGHSRCKDTEARGYILSLLTYLFIHSTHIGHPGTVPGTAVTMLNKMQPMLTTSDPFGINFLLDHN